MKKKTTVVRDYVPLEELYLDPNNPRIVPLEKAKNTAVEDIKNEPVQATTIKLMWQEAKSGINDYYKRLQHEGFLESFPLRVAKLPGGGYVLNDGNTRVAAAKQILQDAAIKKIELRPDIAERIQYVPVEIIEEYGGHEWLKMQAKIHLQGPREWGSSKRAGFVQNVMRKRLTRKETLDILQSKPEVITRYKTQLDMYFDLREKFPKRIDEGHFNTLKEVVYNTACKRYLGFRNGKFGNAGHVAQLMALIAPADGSKPKVNSNTSKLFRTLGDDAAAWDMAVNGSEKDRKYLGLVTEKGKSVNDMMFKLAQRLENLGEKDFRSFETSVAKRLITLLNRAQTTSRAFVKATASAGV